MTLSPLSTVRTALAAALVAAISIASSPGPCPGAETPIRPTEAYLPKFTRTVPRPARAEVPLQVSIAGQAGQEHPVTFGVPFPRGALASAAQVRLIEIHRQDAGAGSKREVPASIRSTATWDRPEGDVKWLLVDAAVAPGKRYALEYGTEVRRADVHAGLRVVDAKEAVTVDSGPLRFVVSRTRPGLIDAAWLDGNGDQTFAADEVLIAPGASGPPSMVDHRGTRYVLARNEYAVTIEEAGPLHGVIKIDGWYQSAEGVKLCQFTARLHAYAGQSLVRVEHTFVVGFDTDQTRLCDIALALALRPGAGAQATFGLEGEARRSALPGRAFLVQDRHDHFSLRSGDGTELARGRRAAGWVDLSGARGGLTVGLRRMWQECPRELEVNGESLVVHLWPAHGDRALDFGARAVLGAERYQAWDRVYHARLYEGGLDQYDQAYGLAKSNDLLLVFHSHGAGPAVAACRTLDEPVIVSATPEWMCRSDVMGPLHARDPQRFADAERKLDAAFARFELLREHAGLYGMIDYGDTLYHSRWDAEAKAWKALPWRRFASRFYGHPVMPWMQFLRSGQRRFLEYGIDNARHVMDVDMCHLTREKVGDYRYAKRRGGRYGGDGGILHYAAGLYDIGCDSHIDHLLLHYYLTGYRRAWDVLQEEADYYLWKDTQPGGHLHGWGHRMTGGALRTLTGLYQATWDPRYLELARRMADFCYANQDEQGVIRFDDVYMLPGMFAYYRATGDERMRELILRCMRRQAKAGRDMADPRSFGFFGLSMAYFMTGDPDFLPWAERWMRDFVRSVTESDDPLWHGTPKGQWDYCYLTLHLLTMPYYMSAAASLEKPVAFMNQDSAVTSGAILLRREETRPFHVSAEWFCYASSHSSGIPIQRLDSYLARNPSAARVVLRAPGGEEVASARVEFDDPGPAPKSAKASRSGRRPVSGRRTALVGLDVPAGAPGTYCLAIEDAGPLHFKLRLAASDLRKWGYATEGEYLACADAYYFYVPADAEQFSLAFKTLALRETVEFAVYDPSGAPARKEDVEFRTSPPSAYTTWAFRPTAGQKAKLWKFTVSPAHPRVEQTYLKFEGVRPVVWTASEAFFPLEADPRAQRRSPPVPRPYPASDEGLRLEPGKPLAIPRGAVQGEGRYEHVDARRGTLEFWFRPEWAADDVSDQTIAAFGKMRLLRRSRLGTYVFLGGIRQTGFMTEAGQWYHLAVTWDGGAAGRAPQTRLFINGVDLAIAPASVPKEPLGDWTGPALTLGGKAPITIADLRVSDVVRYDADFAPPAPAQADAHTLLLRRGK